MLPFDYLLPFLSKPVKIFKAIFSFILPSHKLQTVCCFLGSLILIIVAKAFPSFWSAQIAASILPVILFSKRHFPKIVCAFIALEDAINKKVKIFFFIVFNIV
jgi:hypothetical protein